MPWLCCISKLNVPSPTDGDGEEVDNSTCGLPCADIGSETLSRHTGRRTRRFLPGNGVLLLTYNHKQQKKSCAYFKCNLVILQSQGSSELGILAAQ